MRELLDETTASTRLSSTTTSAAINEPFKYIQRVGMMNRLATNIEEVGGNGSRAITIVPNIGAVIQHPLTHMRRLSMIRRLTPSTTNIIPREKENMLRMLEQRLKIGFPKRDSQRFIKLLPLRKALENSNNASLNTASEGSIMQHHG